MEYKVITDGSPNEVWAEGFFGDQGRDKAQKRIDAGYWHRLMYPWDRCKKLIVVPTERKS